ncbi:BglI family type II restriction endonuclease [Clostridium aminobutyricum]|uniref:BglI family type II restriction endonuclease n=1 Tax=Clostridium aminobutyricum TaxID=33953 RepID=A0A939IJS5_CLOAM|nr:BglI family type II restriction endonuclease [Clostridium aminobutyricum]MBN7774401.1 BglI family type II restriction endonuclease [Clostridium aminobutyricum]
MYSEMRELLFENYNRARSYFIENPDQLISIEQYCTGLVNNIIIDNYDEIEKDYNEASYLNAFWANYPPDDRGRQPVGDQIPWIEVGEHAVGHKLGRIIGAQYCVSEIGLPSGADNRFVLYSDTISQITQGFTNCAFFFLDIKSVGPRDNFDHTVISPYQVSGDGIWAEPMENMINSTMIAQGRRATHSFYPAISPMYPLTNGNVAPTIHLFVKPVYSMPTLSASSATGQPLESIKNICVPNGLLLTENPNYLEDYPGLFFPGKDDKSKDPRKIRVRVSFSLLDKIASWRVEEFKR